MDPVTHGIAGALIGKGYFSDRYGKAATFAAVLGAIFPDVDIFAEAVSRDPMGIVKYHRAITHSFVALPVFAFALALLTRALIPYVRRKFPRWSDVESPPLGILTFIYGIGIASHIVLDGMTSFGTRMWYPISTTRVAWDLLFIIDLSFTAIVLLPQVIAWIYRAGRESSLDVPKSRARAAPMWVIFTAGAFVAWLLTRAAGYPFHVWVAVAASAVLAALFFGPGIGGWGFRITRAGWCQAGLVVTVAYIFACAAAHHSAMLRVREFADAKQIEVNHMAALPIPPSLLDWGDAIRTPDGLYEAQFDLRAKTALEFRYVPDSPPDPYIARAFELPNVQLDWQFARFPSIRSYEHDGMHVVEVGENRFSDGRRRGPQPFTYQVIFNSAGDLVEEGWHANGMLQQRLRHVAPSQPPHASASQPKP